MSASAWWPWILVLCGAVATYAWRGLGVALAGRIRPDSAILEWVACTAYALLAGLIVRMVVLPIGPLAETPLALRVGVTVAVIALYLALGRRIILPVLAGGTAFSLWLVVAG